VIGGGTEKEKNDAERVFSASGVSQGGRPQMQYPQHNGRQRRGKVKGYKKFFRVREGKLGEEKQENSLHGDNNWRRKQKITRQSRWGGGG